MSLWHFIRRLFTKQEQSYDNVQIINVADGTTIQGQAAVKNHFEREKEMLETYGPSIIFQVYRINPQARTLAELQGGLLAEIKVKGDFVSSNDTVSAVIEKVHALLDRGTQNEGRAQFGVTIEESEQITLFFNGRPMQGDTLFYAGNFILLPAWVQVLLHNGTSDDLVQRITELIKKDRMQPG